ILLNPSPIVALALLHGLIVHVTHFAVRQENWVELRPLDQIRRHLDGASLVRGSEQAEANLAINLTLEASQAQGIGPSFGDDLGDTLDALLKSIERHDPSRAGQGRDICGRSDLIA